VPADGDGSDGVAQRGLRFSSLGFLRRVYAEFLQLAGFMAMNLDAHWHMFMRLVEGHSESRRSRTV
jgi:poly-beta-hydroxyalkanoate depolymerase